MLNIGKNVVRKETGVGYVNKVKGGSYVDTVFNRRHSWVDFYGLFEIRHKDPSTKSVNF